MENFLKSIELIISKYKEIEKITGEHYNIFSVMGMENNEVKTHSAIIGDLLNPNGSHFMGDVFLKLFIDSVFTQSESQKLIDFIFEIPNSKCLVEEFVGKKNEEQITGGRIDIVLKDLSNNIIVIENKIFAPEQENQIPRYRNTYSEAAILYLTLFGNGPKNRGELKKGIDFHLISYKEDIIRWLELCLKETVNQPILRETLKQYIVLLKKLTNQSTNKEMSKEIINQITNNFESSYEIYKNFEKALVKKQNDFLKDIISKISDDFKNWNVELTDFKKTKCIELTKNNLFIRYRIKTLKHSAFGIKGIGELSDDLVREGFSENKKDKSDNFPIYWLVNDNDISISEMLNYDYKANEISEKLKRIKIFLENNNEN